MKRLFEFTYGYDGDWSKFSTKDRYILEDNQKNRKRLIKKFNGWSCLDDYEEFINGKIQEIGFIRDGNEYEMICGVISVYTYEEKMEKLKQNYQQEIRSVDRLFKRSENLIK